MAKIDDMYEWIIRAVSNSNPTQIQDYNLNQTPIHPFLHQNTKNTYVHYENKNLLQIKT